MAYSWEGHFDANPDEGGAPHRDRFLEKHVNCLFPAFCPKEESSPEAHLYMGAPGSGKSVVRNSARYGNTAAWVTIDPDEFKVALQRNSAPALSAEEVHAESSWLAKQARAVTIGRSCSMVNDSVGGSSRKYAALIGKLKSNGYRVSLICLHVLDINVLLYRVVERKKKTGRTVPVNIVREGHRDIPAAFNELRHFVDFSVLLNGMDATEVWRSDNMSVRNENFLISLGEVGTELLR